MDVFDGFIGAIATEFKMQFHKTKDGCYTTTVYFDNDRTQEVLITLAFDEAGDRLINYYSIIAQLKSDFGELFKFALKVNASLDYGAIALMENSLILRDSILLEACDPHRFMKALTYIAAKADELEEMLIEKDKF